MWRLNTLLLSLLLLSACQAPPLRLGVGIWPPLEPLFLAQNQNFFTQAGIAVELVHFATPSDSRRAFERGQIDGFAASLDEFLGVWHSPREAHIVLALSSYHDTHGDNFAVLVWDAKHSTQRPSDITRLHHAWNLSVAYLQHHPQQAYTRMAERGQLSAAAIAAWNTDTHAQFLPASAAILKRNSDLSQSLRRHATRLLQQGRLPLLLPDTDKMLVAVPATH
jgi:ABC-type nitrate/sulfonate/bicarbonate transport system substrate-binding protein